MKLVQFNSYGPWGTQGVLKQVLNVKIGGMLLEEMRKRVSLSKKLFDDDKANHAILDEEEFKIICESLRTFPFGVAQENLLKLIDDVLDSKEPPVVMLRPPKKDKAATAGDKA